MSIFKNHFHALYIICMVTVAMFSITDNAFSQSKGHSTYKDIVFNLPEGFQVTECETCYDEFHAINPSISAKIQISSRQTSGTLSEVGLKESKRLLMQEVKLIQSRLEIKYTNQHYERLYELESMIPIELPGMLAMTYYYLTGTSQPGEVKFTARNRVVTDQWHYYVTYEYLFSVNQPTTQTESILKFFSTITPASSNQKRLTPKEAALLSLLKEVSKEIEDADRPITLTDPQAQSLAETGIGYYVAMSHLDLLLNEVKSNRNKYAKANESLIQGGRYQANMLRLFPKNQILHEVAGRMDDYYESGKTTFSQFSAAHTNSFFASLRVSAGMNKEFNTSTIKEALKTTLILSDLNFDVEHIMSYTDDPTALNNAIQIEAASEALIPFQDISGPSPKWGYQGALSSRIHIPAKFDYAAPFSEGLAQVKDENQLSGYINKQGNLVIPFQYLTARKFLNGQAQVKKRKRGKWLRIDNQGNILK